MLSSVDLERLITEKRREIELEKTLLGLSPADNDTAKDTKIVTFTPEAGPKAAEDDANNQSPPEATTPETTVDGIPPDLERYIRRYLGLPVMLRAGEYSPNNPLVRGERTPGDALRGLGEYERRRHTLRRAQQRQYREMLDQQAKKKQEAKEQAERERREREEKERLEEERQRQREEVEREIRVELERDRRVVLEQDRRAFEDRRLELERERRVQRERDRSPEIRRASYTYTGPTNLSYVTKVDTGVQVDAGSAPLSVAVQTDEHLYTPNRQLCNLLTEAERELSPHTAEPRAEPYAWPTWRERRRSCGDFDKPVAAACREARTVPRYQPSILDGDAVQLRNELAEKEALERRRWYERELRHQIQEQQRLRNQRTARERLLEQAETRRLEEQLRGLRVAHERERQRQRAATQQMKEHASEFDMKRNKLQQEIEAEERLLKLKQPDTDRPHRERRPYSMNIPEDIFSHNYDVESYLRRNLNPTKESLISNAFEKDKLKSFGEKIGREYDSQYEVKEKNEDTRFDKVNETDRNAGSIGEKIGREYDYTKYEVKEKNEYTRFDKVNETDRNAGSIGEKIGREYDYTKCEVKEKNEDTRFDKVNETDRNAGSIGEKIGREYDYTKYEVKEKNEYTRFDKVNETDRNAGSIGEKIGREYDYTKCEVKEKNEDTRFDKVNETDRNAGSIGEKIGREYDYTKCEVKEKNEYTRFDKVNETDRNAGSIGEKIGREYDYTKCEVKEKNEDTRFDKVNETDRNAGSIGEKIGREYDYTKCEVKEKNEDTRFDKVNETDRNAGSIGEKIGREYDYTKYEVKEKNEDTRYDKVPKPKPRARETRDDDTLPIPVLRHSPKRTVHSEPDTQLSDAMQIVDDKWRVPVVQKNILKSIPNEGGKPVSILTQLGSIRRQLQMEQLKLDKMLSINKQT